MKNIWKNYKGTVILVCHEPEFYEGLEKFTNPVIIVQGVEDLADAVENMVYGGEVSQSENLMVTNVRHKNLLDEGEKCMIDALEMVEELSTIYIKNWSKVSGKVRNRAIASNLTAKEHEVAKLTAFGLTVPEISKKLFVSESTIKQTIVRVIHKTGIQDKNEFS